MTSTIKTLIIAAAAVASIAMFGTAFYLNTSKSMAYSQSASLLLPLNTEAQVGQEISLPIVLDTNNNTVVGVDVNVNFDQSRLELVDILPSAQSTTSFNTYSPVVNGIEFDKQSVIALGNNAGTVKFSALTYKENSAGQAEIPTPFSGTTQLALLKFRALAEGQTAVSFVKASGQSSTDSNIVSDSNPPIDVLAVTNSAAIAISRSTVPALTSTPVPTSTLALSPTSVAAPSATRTPTAVPTSTPVVTAPSATRTPTTAPSGQQTNKMIKFDGRNDIVRTSALSGISNKFTIEFYAKIDDTQQTRSETKILFANTDDKTGWSIEYKNNAIEFWYVNTRGEWKNIRYSKNISTNAWHHIALSYDGSTARLFVDGKLSNSSRNVGRLSGSPSVYIGGMPGYSYYFGGSMDEIRVSSSARYSANFTAPKQKYASDANTENLYHIDNYEGIFVFDATENGGMLTLGTGPENTRPIVSDSDSPAK